MVDGGADRDVVSYASHTAAVDIDLRGGPILGVPWPEGEDMMVPGVVATGSERLTAPGKASVVLKFRRSVRRRLARVKVLRATLVISARDAAGNAAEVRRSVTIRR